MDDKKMTLGDVWFDKAYNVETHDFDYCWDQKTRALAWVMMQNEISINNVQKN